MLQQLKQYGTDAEIDLLTMKQSMMFKIDSSAYENLVYDALDISNLQKYVFLNI